MEDLETRLETDLKKIALKIIDNKTKSQKFLDMFMETEDADESEDISKLNKSDRDQYAALILAFLKEETEIIDELEEEITASLNARKVLLAEKQRLLEKTQDLEEKYSDLK